MEKEKSPLDDWNLFNQQQETEIQGSNELKKEYLTVSEFLDSVNLELSKISCRVLGEISDVNPRDRYCFFVLKESNPDVESAIVECFIGWRSFEAYKHLLKDGMQVIVSGFPGIYKKSGRFRIDVSKIEPFGEGALKQAFEALKKKLEEKGYFSPERKKPVPDIIQRIGLVTSMAGAAIKDFMRNLGQYGFQIYHINVYVEGAYAVDSIISAIRYFNRNISGLDVIVLIRGGGSLESLKAFNDEDVANAIFDSKLPVITGIGHERDITIADLVADRSFSTPTAVAAFIRNQREQLIQNIQMVEDVLISSSESILEDLYDELELLKQNVLAGFENILQKYSFSIRHCAEKMHGCFKKVFDSFKEIERRFVSQVSQWHLLIKQMESSLSIFNQQAVNFFQASIERIRNQVEVLQAKLASLNPESILSKGYSIVYDSQNNLIKKATQVKKDDSIWIKLHKGKIISIVDKTEDF
ncbi:MAG: exodeoxyribonuclease VII large subunit [Candidatus Omnitrophica bacterium]|nr:exodeoxyribonuclease VII large subunit [Candidatus Omnitrophota bacterium]MCM8825051.1 exodeoxyribonuclease VII large subunit [Candidatus Omnitrophota bacterium]